MAERTGPVDTQDSDADDPVQDTYSAFIKHIQQCPPCRKDGADCDTAAGLRQAWRKAKDAAVAA
ncbi:hypothetical protein ABZ154_03505 [Streptomyces sp. NPDC006261]|uniref:hypothetical protein n=1 Tax=Streptomyces sp. NPDC006261 TaxID=3156739 RepID=UPI0033A863A2